jgi:hypothetical protein
MAKVDIALVKRQSSIELILPRYPSAAKPKHILPQADARLKPAMMSEDEVGVNPTEVQNKGRKKGGLGGYV